MSEKENVAKTTSPGKIALIALACIGSFAYTATRFSGPPNVPAILGEHLVYGLVVWVLVSIALKPIGAAVQTSAFFGIWISLSLGAWTAASTNAAQANIALSEIQAAASDLLDPSQIYEPQTSEMPSQRDQAPKARGVFGEVEGLVKRFWAQVREAQQRYHSELGAIGWNGILEPERAERLVESGEGKFIIQRAQALVDKQEARLDQLFAEFRKQIESSDASREAREAMLAGFDKGLADARAGQEAMFGLERKIVDTVSDIYDFLERARGEWSVQNGQIVFLDDWQVQVYNDYLADIDHAMAKQAELLESTRDDLTSTLAEAQRHMETGQ